MTEDKKSEIVAHVVEAVSTLWTSYKTIARRRHETPTQTIINDLFGKQLSDREAAVELGRDVVKLHDKMQEKKTERKFNDIINHSY